MKTVIVGGVAGGASAAARLRRLREHDDIIMFEKGEYISFANCGLPYHISNVIEKRKALTLQSPKSFNARFNVDVRTLQEIISVDTKAKNVVVRDLNIGSEYREPYDRLILSPGSEAVMPPFADTDLGGRVFKLNSIPDMDGIKAYIETKGASSAVVIGGGFIGMETAENLKKAGLKVDLVELASHIMTFADWDMAKMIESEFENNGVSVHTGEGVAALEEKDGKAIVKTDKAEYSADIVIVAVGVRPATGFLAGSGIALNRRGAIIVDERMKTSAPDVYAAGDAVQIKNFVSGAETSIPLAGPANKQGRIAADQIAGIDSIYTGTQGSAIIKVFDKVFAATGLSESSAENYEKNYISAASHAGYYPGASSMWIKLLFDKKSGRVLGAQAFGQDGVDKRMDIFAVAIRCGLDVNALSQLELCYAPPFGAAKDPVNMAGFAAQNIVSGLVDVVHGDIIEKLDMDKQSVLDVRTQREYDSGHMDISVHISLDELRGRIGELDKSKEWIVHCASGLRSYVACRMLSQNGFKCKNLSGGYNLYHLLYK